MKQKESNQDEDNIEILKQATSLVMLSLTKKVMVETLHRLTEISNMNRGLERNG